MLGRRAARLFAHMKDALRRAKLVSPFGADYSAVLRSHLLTVPAYCAAVPASTFQGALAGDPAPQRPAGGSQPQPARLLRSLSHR